MVATFIPPFEQLAKRKINQLQKIILKGLHDHIFQASFFNFLSILHRVCLRSCVGLRLKCRCMILWSPNDFFPNWLQMFFPLNCAFVQVSPSLNPWFVTLHLQSTFGPYGDPSFLLHHGEKMMISHDVVWDAFVSITRDVRFLVLCEHTHVFLLPTFFFFHINESIVWFRWMVFKRWLILSSLTSFKRIWFHM